MYILTHYSFCDGMCEPQVFDFFEDAQERMINEMEEIWQADKDEIEDVHYSNYNAVISYGNGCGEVWQIFDMSDTSKCKEWNL